jgi:hypothetical protein
MQKPLLQQLTLFRNHRGDTMVPKIIEEIENMIKNKFSSVNIVINEVPDTDEYFIMIDDKDLYESDDYLMFVTDISLNVLLKNGITNVFFSYTSPQRRTYIAEEEIRSWAHIWVPSIDTITCHHTQGVIVDTNIDSVWISQAKYLVGAGAHKYLPNNSLTIDAAKGYVSPSWTPCDNHSYDNQTPKFTISGDLNEQDQGEDNENIRLAA